MKIIVTGSLGNISKPLTQELVKNGHQVTVVSSKPEKEKAIQALGATAAIGSLEDAGFLVTTFAGADVVYSMVPPANYFNHSLDFLEYYRSIGSNYAYAIGQAKVKRVINLSSIGAHLDKENGILRGANRVENILNELPADVVITHIRPTEFYYNLLPHARSAKNNGYIAFNIGNEVVNSWVSPVDIAAAIAEEISVAPATERNVRYVASEELTYDELVAVLGIAVGNPELKWKQLTDEQMENGLIAKGMNPKIANQMAEMYAAINSGLLYEDYNSNKPKVMGNVKVADFSKDFAQAYNEL
ncbi:NAD(P)H-binding protein [Flavobacterium sp. RHBU_24]|uniref:NmrA family NAD(P)-binding protein n=1 Tax=Flavobacterium sp. RHBU_24 TaxID=3391185 RepID=UPI0039854002